MYKYLGGGQTKGPYDQLNLVLTPSSRNHLSLSLSLPTSPRDLAISAQIISNAEAAEDSSMGLINGHKAQTFGRLNITSWPKLCFRSWALRWNNPLATF